MSLARRNFDQQSLGALLTYSLLETLCTRERFAADMKLLAANSRLIAVCRVHQIENMLRFNVGHLSRLTALVPGITILDPMSFVPPTSQTKSQSQ